MNRIHRSPMDSPHKGQWRGALMFSLICAWTNVWVNSLDAGNVICHRVHNDVIILSVHMDSSARFTYIFQRCSSSTWAIVWFTNAGEVMSTDMGKLIRTWPRLNTRKRRPCVYSWVVLYYRQTSNIKGTLVDNKIVDHSDVDGASPASAAPTTSSFST